MLENIAFAPEWVSPPGDTIADILRERRLSAAEFARELGDSSDVAHGLLQGRVAITEKMAQVLARVLGASEAFWINREAQYRQDIARLQTRLDAHSCSSWLRELPVKYIVSRNWVDSAESPVGTAAACLRFFGVPTIEAWREACEEMLQSGTFRTSRTLKSDPGAVAAWMREGELKSVAMPCSRWDSERFRTALLEIRKLTRQKAPESFLRELQHRCAECGVAVVVARAPAKCPASGATKILPRNRRLVLLSFRYLSDDHFWFTFFHEAGHLLLHQNTSLFLDDLDPNVSGDKEEEEANAFAADVLIPRQYRGELLRLPRETRRVMRFAKDIGVSPGIVVGQLQHHGRFGYDQMNHLKHRFTWGK